MSYLKISKDERHSDQSKSTFFFPNKIVDLIRRTVLSIYSAALILTSKRYTMLNHDYLKVRHPMSFR